MRTHTPLAGSPLVNTGDTYWLFATNHQADINGDGTVDGGDDLTTDQIGNARVQTGWVDIGAVESSLSRAPELSINDNALAVNEGETVKVDALATFHEPDDGSDMGGATLVVQISAGAEALDSLTIPDNAVTTINTDGTDLRRGSKVIGTLSAAEGTVTGSAALTITFNSNAVGSFVQEVLRAIHFTTTEENPAASRTVTFTATDPHGASAVDTRTLNVANLHDATGAAALIVTTAQDRVADDGQISLREAMATAAATAGDDTITFDLAAMGADTEINLDSSLTYNFGALGNLTIDGDGIGSDDDTASVTVSGDSGDDGTRDVQVFRFYETSVDVSLTDLIVRDGTTTGQGGGVVSQADSLTLTPTEFVDNTAGIAAGAVYSAGDLTVVDSRFADNEAGAHVAGPHSGGDGGAIQHVNTGSVSISGSTFENNSVVGNSEGGALYIGGSADVNITASTFANNSATSLGGALRMYDNDRVTISDSVFHSNTMSDSHLGGKGKRIYIRVSNAATRRPSSHDHRQQQLGRVPGECRLRQR